MPRVLNTTWNDIPCKLSIYLLSKRDPLFLWLALYMIYAIDLISLLALPSVRPTPTNPLVLFPFTVSRNLVIERKGLGRHLDRIYLLSLQLHRKRNAATNS